MLTARGQVLRFKATSHANTHMDLCLCAEEIQSLTKRGLKHKLKARVGGRVNFDKCKSAVKSCLLNYISPCDILSEKGRVEFRITL